MRSSCVRSEYGRKEILCNALKPAWATPGNDSLALATLFASYTRDAWGAGYFIGCFYNSSCMASATSGNVAESARSWYWMKCAHLGYLQVCDLPYRPAHHCILLRMSLTLMN